MDLEKKNHLQSLELVLNNAKTNMLFLNDEKDIRLFSVHGSLICTSSSDIVSL